MKKAFFSVCVLFLISTSCMEAAPKDATSSKTGTELSKITITLDSSSPVDEIHPWFTKLMTLDVNLVNNTKSGAETCNMSEFSITQVSSGYNNAACLFLMDDQGNQLTDCLDGWSERVQVNTWTWTNIIPANLMLSGNRKIEIWGYLGAAGEGKNLTLTLDSVVSNCSVTGLPVASNELWPVWAGEGSFIVQPATQPDIVQEGPAREIFRFTIDTDAGDAYVEFFEFWRTFTFDPPWVNNESINDHVSLINCGLKNDSGIFTKDWSQYCQQDCFDYQPYPIPEDSGIGTIFFWSHDYGTGDVAFLDLDRELYIDKNSQTITMVCDVENKTSTDQTITIHYDNFNWAVGPSGFYINGSDFGGMDATITIQNVP